VAALITILTVASLWPWRILSGHSCHRKAHQRRGKRHCSN
jgi:hypothetical protein